MAVGIKGNAFADLEIQHSRVRPHLAQKPQALDDPVVQVDKFRFAEFIDINLRHGSLFI
jgi:hypothetical protein